MQTFRSCFLAKVLVQVVQAKGFTDPCDSWCRFRSELVTYEDPHTSQTNDLSPGDNRDHRHMSGRLSRSFLFLE